MSVTAIEANIVVAEYKKTVLIVDNEAKWRTELEVLLCQDFLVIVASNCSEALGHLSNSNVFIHVVITELSLNQSDEENQEGFKIVEHANAAGQNIQSIILTRYPTVPAAVVACRDYHVLDFIDKAPKEGFNETSFLKVVRKAADLSKEKVFLIMPFAEQFAGLHGQITTIVDSMGLECHRADDVFNPNVVMASILEQIKRCRIAIADLSGQNANVYYETGIAHAMGKKVILVTRSEADVLNNLRPLRYLAYEDSFAGAISLKNNLSQAIEDVRLPHIPPLDPVHAATDSSLCVLLTREDVYGQDTYQQIIEPVLESFKLRKQQMGSIFDARDLLRARRETIHAAQLLIADVSSRDPDIFYLAGYAYGVGKHVIYMAGEEKDIPFDLRVSSAIIFSKDIKSAIIEAQTKLSAAIVATLQKLDVSVTARLGESNTLDATKTKKTKKNGKNSSRGDMKKKVKVFVNHATEDKPLVRPLYEELRKYSWIDPWFDEADLLPGQDWRLEIDKAMDESDAFLICLSGFSIQKKGYVQAEIRKAEDQQNLRPRGSIYMIPILLEKCRVPANLKGYHWVDLSQPDGIDKLIKSLETLK